MLSNQRIKAFVSTVQPSVAREFYEKNLGLNLLSQDKYGIEFEANEAHIRLSVVEKLTPQPLTILGWDTDDIVSAINDLSANGIIFERYNFIEQDENGIWTAPGGTRVAWFKDPDGNLLSVSDKQ